MRQQVLLLVNSDNKNFNKKIIFCNYVFIILYTQQNIKNISQRQQGLCRKCSKTLRTKSAELNDTNRQSSRTTLDSISVTTIESMNAQSLTNSNRYVTKRRQDKGKKI